MLYEQILNLHFDQQTLLRCLGDILPVYIHLNLNLQPPHLEKQIFVLMSDCQIYNYLDESSGKEYLDLFFRLLFRFLF